MLYSRRLQERKLGLSTLDKLYDDKERVYIIHYSGESFKNPKGRSPRIAAISMINLFTRQAKTFSIHLSAQMIGYDFNDLNETQTDQCEKLMLRDFADSIKSW